MHAAAHTAASCSVRDRDELLPALEAFGIPVSWHESSMTTSYSFRYEGDCRIMRQDAVGEPWSVAQSVEAVGDARWVHVGALTRSDFGADALEALAHGRTLLVDGQGLARTPALGPLVTDGDVGDLLPYVTILKLDEDEAAALAGSSDPDRIRVLSVPEVILTLGSRGSFVVTPSQVAHVPAHDIGGAVDPTGAGDTFSAAYLNARAGGAQPVEAARAATSVVAEFLTAH